MLTCFMTGVPRPRADTGEWCYMGSLKYLWIGLHLYISLLLICKPPFFFFFSPALPLGQLSHFLGKEQCEDSTVAFKCDCWGYSVCGSSSGCALFFHKNKISYAKWVTWKHQTISPEQQPVFHAGEMLANHWHMDVISVTLTRFGFYRVREKGR